MGAKTGSFLANRQGEGKASPMWVASSDAYFGEYALTISMLPKF
jgi:hypothetical protein